VHKPRGAHDEVNGKLIAGQIGHRSGRAHREREVRPLAFRPTSATRSAAMNNTSRARLIAQQTVDELFSLKEPPGGDQCS